MRLAVVAGLDSPEWTIDTIGSMPYYTYTALRKAMLALIDMTSSEDKAEGEAAAGATA
jgi:hypothetical protein